MISCIQSALLLAVSVMLLIEVRRNSKLRAERVKARKEAQQAIESDVSSITILLGDIRQLLKDANR